MFTCRSFFPSRDFASHICLAVAFATASLTPSQAQSVTPSPKITIFLADPVLGVVGACQSGATTLYFEARKPEGSLELSARLLDAAGRNIALSGHSMDAQWLTNTAFDADDATQSLGIAEACSKEFPKAFTGASSVQESAALTALVLGASQNKPTTEAARVDVAVENLPAAIETRSDSDIETQKLLSDLTIKREESSQQLQSSFRGVMVDTFVHKFADDGDIDNMNEEGTGPRIEVSGRIVSPSGETQVLQLGGDEIPDGWDIESRSAPITGDPIKTSSKIGDAILATTLIVRHSSPKVEISQEELDTIERMGRLLRDNALLPHPIKTADVSDDNEPQSFDPNEIQLRSLPKPKYQTNVEVWDKPLPDLAAKDIPLPNFPWIVRDMAAKALDNVVKHVATHSGTIVNHWSSTDGKKWTWNGNTIFCNHGTCPADSGHVMSKKCATKKVDGMAEKLPFIAIPSSDTGSGSGKYHSCGTPYDLFSGFKFKWMGLSYTVNKNPGHNCNDDSWTQVQTVLGNKDAGKDKGKCNDDSLDNTAPSCS